MTSIVRPSAVSAAGLVLSRIVLGFLISGVLREIYRWHAARQAGTWNRAGIMIGSCLALALLENPINLLLARTYLPLPQTAELFHGGRLVVLWFIILTVWSGFYVAFQRLEGAHALELRAELKARKNQLRHLQSQMNPHFLFNALNTVLASKKGPEAVGEITQNLADYLRFLLREA